MLKALRRYIAQGGGKVREELQELPSDAPSTGLTQEISAVPPIIWETGNINQIRSLLVVREAELVVAKAQLTGNRYFDWHTRNRILDLETKISDLRKWLNEAMEKKDGR